jgi:hypothetical protein
LASFYLLGRLVLLVHYLLPDFLDEVAVSYPARPFRKGAILVVLAGVVAFDFRICVGGGPDQLEFRDDDTAVLCFD